LTLYALSFVLPLSDSDFDLARNSGAALCAEACVALVCNREYESLVAPFILAPNIAFLLGLFRLFQQKWVRAVIWGSVALLGALFGTACILLDNHPDYPGGGYYAWILAIALFVGAGIRKVR
jgi:hypothetical protein